MEKRVILLLGLILFFSTISIVQATDYASLKNEYVTNHPVQSIIPFPWNPSSSTRILPFNFEIPASGSIIFQLQHAEINLKPPRLLLLHKKISRELKSM